MNEQPEPAVIHNDPGDWPSRRAGLRDELVKALGEIPVIPPVAHRRAQADAVLTVLYREWPWLQAEAEDAWTPPPPGSTREQLPDHLLALIDIPPYTSTACEIAELLATAIGRHPEHADELRQWESRQRQRCRINNKYTGVHCQHTAPEPAATEATETAICPHGCNTAHCPCLACEAEPAIEEPTTRVTALYEQWVKAGPPPLGVPLARWWDRRLAELHDAIRATATEATEATDGQRCTCGGRFPIHHLHADRHEPAADDGPELGAEKTRTQDLALSLYYAQDALGFVAERCDLADQQQRTVTTTEVRQWLKGARCARQHAAEQRERTTGNNPPTSKDRPHA